MYRLLIEKIAAPDSRAQLLIARKIVGLTRELVEEGIAEVEKEGGFGYNDLLARHLCELLFRFAATLDGEARAGAMALARVQRTMVEEAAEYDRRSSAFEASALWDFSSFLSREDLEARRRTIEGLLEIHRRYAGLMRGMPRRLRDELGGGRVPEGSIDWWVDVALEGMAHERILPFLRSVEALMQVLDELIGHLSATYGRWRTPEGSDTLRFDHEDDEDRFLEIGARLRTLQDEGETIQIAYLQAIGSLVEDVPGFQNDPHEGQA